ncbi:MAG TPA: ABC transporter ATP-binding protein [Ornithinibacter sp.]|jgi:ABC-type lipoprotein export system ATPase subunit|uniref:ABC transporter ATP-binding protein n=1 Tax=Ornithinibacter sp. TaxID=2862748 RepID=UPI001B6E9078|nr:ABC transporter ATP-binding protein [Ornithinibacter sp.]MBP6523865.1 ABC transporter ATP-binding protein [Dermatophilaceae bacterium]MBU9943673.1 ABC transporter ATP-binding protein [Dermatophilaceae bacterium]HQV83292.1 ABC transporter ATP-binding protein [Ornithinibacter sp.]HQW72683.1 ABC transporter ATP-binding protein [Ornithinibacter sp.]HQX86535.1 ABC transporter ATP-binding protein [Ornithinibacter sp.]
MTSAAAPVLEAQEVTRTFPGAPPLRVLRGVSLAVHRGERVAIFGRSGAGKSTLLNILGLLDEATTGRYQLLGHDVATRRGAQRDRLRASALGFVFQAHHIIGHRTATENLELKLSVIGTPRAERATRIAGTLDGLGLGDHAQALGATLSGGEKQRLAIARAVIADPAIVLADEPTGNLDDSNTAEVLALFDTQVDRGGSVVLITHDRRAAAWADQAYTLADGILRRGLDR